MRPGFIVLAATLLTAPALAQEAPGPVPPPAEAAASSQDLAARVEALEQALAEERLAREAALESEAVADAEPRLQLYGFMEAGLQRLVHSDKKIDGLLASSESTFVSGNSHLYIDARPMPGWRGLLETRFTLNPHGYYEFTTVGPAKRTNTRIVDFTSPSLRDWLQLGGIVIERAQIEWTHSDLLTILTGYFLTPWAIWNVDHGSPVTIPLILPSYLLHDTIPRQQAGVQALGSLHFSAYELGYRAYVSNGRTTTQFDLTDNKALGGRLFLRRTGRARFMLGSSGFYSTTEDREKLFTLAGSDQIRVESRTNYAFREWVAGADLSLDWAGLRVRAEALLRHIRYRDGAHEPLVSIPGARLPSRYEHASYGIIAYRIGPFEPYVYFEIGDRNVNTNYTPDRGWAASAGLNIHFSPVTQLKMQYMDARFENIAGKNSLGFFTSRLVLVF